MYATGASNYTWQPGGFTTISIFPTINANTCYTVTGKNSSGCTAQAIHCVSVTPTQSMSVSGGGTVCAGTPVTFIASGANTYLWVNGTQSLTGSVITVTPTGSTCYSVQGTNGSACNSYSTACVTIGNTGVPISGPTNVCLGGTATLVASGALSYTWSNGVNSPSIIITPSVNSCYYVSGTNSNGCTSPASKCVTVSVTASISVSPSLTTVCKGSSATLWASGVSTYTWTTGSNSPSVNVSPTVNTVYTVYGKTSLGCIGFKTVEVVVNPNCSDVWPGDANNNGVVTNLDIFEIGLAYLNTGPSRSPGGNTYISQYANNWTGLVSTGKNKCHADCNGDGIVNLSDTLAVYNNFSLTHPFRPSGPVSGNVDIGISPAAGQFIPGVWNKVDILLGDVSNTMSSIAGVAFDLGFDQSMMVPDSAYLVYNQSFLNAGNQNVQFRKKDFSNGVIYAASVRVDGLNVNGYGKIGEFNFKMKSALAGNSVLNMQLLNCSKINQAGLNATINGGTSQLSIGAVGINKLSSIQNAIRIYPNPAVNELTLSSNLLNQITYAIFDVTGREILNGNFTGTKTLELDNLTSGTYVVRFESDKETLHKKLTICR
jgi:hypothetical protein